ncbi:hypothetical protein AKH18_00955 [Pelagibacteraceae bacterium GOM-A4]|nr:hypothetical protein AKH18_00955 [Pelagibacteraceae bacterium GOM-A4]
MKKKIIFILIESAKRELNSKTLLALRALNKNYRVVIGHKGTIWSIFNKCNPGIVLLKSFGPKNTDTINLLKKKKFKILSNDEEIILAWDMNERIEYRMNNENLNKIDVLLTVGDTDSNEIKKQFPKLLNKTKKVGNIRLELLKKKNRSLLDDETDNIRKKHGNFILFTTQFGRVNIIKRSEKSIDFVFSRVIDDKADPESAHILNVNNQISMQREILLQTIKFLDNFEVNFPNKKIIISPHPVENKLFWEDYISKRKFKNIILNKDNLISINSLINASDLVISSNSTSLLEAYLLDKKIINFLGKKTRLVEIDFLKKISNVVRSADELVNILNSENNIKKIDKTPDMAKTIKNLEYDYDAIDELINVFSDIKHVESFESIFISKKTNKIFYLKNFFREFKNLVKKLIKFKRNTVYDDLYREKIGDKLSYKSFYKKVNQINKIEKIKNLKFTQLIPKVFLLDKE